MISKVTWFTKKSIHLLVVFVSHYVIGWNYVIQCEVSFLTMYLNCLLLTAFQVLFQVTEKQQQ